MSELVRKLRKQELLWLSRSILLCERRVNFALEQNSFWATLVCAAPKGIVF